MRYSLTKHEPVPEALPRTVREQIKLALAQLLVPAESHFDKNVHEARKCIKKARAIVRLAPAGPDEKRANGILRDAGRELSRLRDAAALIETVDSLAGTCSVAELRTVLAEKQKALEPGEPVRRALGALRRFPKSFDKAWLGVRDGFPVIASGLKRTYRRGRRALARAQDAPSPENFHELRKRVKDHWYHVRLLEGLSPRYLKARAKCLKDLQEWLGEDHNLAVLREMETVSESADLRSAIDARQENLRKKAIEMAEEIYRERPRDHVVGLRDLWNRTKK